MAACGHLAGSTWQIDPRVITLVCALPSVQQQYGPEAGANGFQRPSTKQAAYYSASASTCCMVQTKGEAGKEVQLSAMQPGRPHAWCRRQGNDKIQEVLQHTQQQAGEVCLIAFD